MEEKKHTGIWMDHSSAHLMELKGNEIISKTIESKFTHAEKEKTLVKSENLMHHQEQHLQASYYKKISEALVNQDEILLFGPTTAKNELSNILKADHHFAKAKIKVIQADKMTENQQHDFVRHHFQISI